MSEERELEKRILDWIDKEKIYYADMCGNDIQTLNSVLDETKKDIENEACFEAYSYSLTESEESIIIPLRIWKKWFGNNNKETVYSAICNQCDDYSTSADKMKCPDSPYKDGLCHG